MSDSETEIKLVATPAAIDSLRLNSGIAGFFTHQSLITYYYDTSDSRLNASHMALRIRNDGHGLVQTFKSNGPSRDHPFKRGEWSVPIDSERLSLGRFPSEVRQIIEDTVGQEPLYRFAKVATLRETRDLSIGNSLCEIALDTVTITAARRKTSFCEVELELKHGSLADLFQLALKLPVGPELYWSVVSKSERAYALQRATALPTNNNAGFTFDSTTSVVEAFQKIAWSCLIQFLRHYPLIASDKRASDVHQGRVALRRLRTAFYVFKHVLHAEDAQIYGAEFRALASAMGKARNLDVLIAELQKAGGVAHTDHEDYEQVLAFLRTQRENAYRELCAFLFSSSCQSLLLRFALWLEELPHNTAHQNNSETSLTDAAVNILTQLHTKIAKSVTHIERLSISERHKLRIKIKKLRYATGFFSSLFIKPRQLKAYKEYNKSLVNLQDALGELHDLSAINPIADCDLSPLDPITRAHHTFILECYSTDRAQHVKARLKTAEQAGHAFNHADVYW